MAEKKIKGKVTFDKDGCKGCSLCVEACPLKILALSETEINAKGYHPVEMTDADKCIACGSCAIMCPDSIITVERLG